MIVLCPVDVRTKRTADTRLPLSPSGWVAVRVHRLGCTCAFASFRRPWSGPVALPSARDRIPLPDRTEPAQVRLRAGIRRGLPFGLAVFLIAVSYGVLARPVMGTVAPIVMSIVVFSGSAQLGSLAILAAGGGAGAAIVAGILLNARYLAMGLALAPSLRGRALSRAAFAMTVGAAVVAALWRAVF